MRSVLETDRLILRPLGPADQPALGLLLDDLRVSAHLGAVPYPYREADAAAWIALQPGFWAGGEHFVYAVTRRDSGAFVGSVGLQLSDRHAPASQPMWTLGYWIGVPHWGQGLATEAVMAVLAEAEQALKPVGFVAGVFIENTRSCHVLVKLGFQETGTQKQMMCLARGGPVIGRVLMRLAPSHASALHLAGSKPLFFNPSTPLEPVPLPQEAGRPQ